MKYLIHVDGVGAFVELSRDVEHSSEEYGYNQRMFAEKYDSRNIRTPSGAWPAEMVSLWSDQVTHNGLHYDYDLCYDGGLYRLVALPSHTLEQVNEAKAYIRQNFDVVALKVLRIKRLVDFRWETLTKENCGR